MPGGNNNYRVWAPYKRRTRSRTRRRTGSKARTSATYQAFMRGLRAGRRSPTTRRGYRRRRY